MGQIEELLPPPGFVSLEAALTKPDQTLNVMGVVVDFMPPTSTRGTDFQSSFRLFDRSLRGCNVDLKVKFFKPSLKDLPCVEKCGDVVALYNIKVKNYHREELILSNRTSEWAVFPANAIPKELPPGNPGLRPISNQGLGTPSLAEQLYAISLCNTQDRTECPVLQKDDAPRTLVQLSAPAPRRKFALLQDVEVDSYYNLVGQVIKVWPARDNRCELYVTDYTSNDLFFKYEWGRKGTEMGSDAGESFGAGDLSGRSDDWPGPFGRMTLQVTLWDIHAYHAQVHVKEQSFVYLKNVKIKFGQDGAALRYEGIIYKDRDYPDRIGVSVIKDLDSSVQIQEVLERKEAYWNKARKQRDEYLKDVGRLKRQQRDGESVEDGKKKTRKRRKARREDNDRAPDTPQPVKQHSNKHGSLILPQTNSEEDLANSMAVLCSHEKVPTLPVSDILHSTFHETKSPNGTVYNLPFQNIRCRVSVRVVDFFPPRLEDFAVMLPMKEGTLNDDKGRQSGPRWRHMQDAEKALPEAPRWEWRFYLLLEDRGKKDKIKALVAGKDADQLLGMRCENLRENDNLLLRLKEKLFLLWGDLEEQKSAVSRGILSEKDPNARPHLIGDKGQKSSRPRGDAPAALVTSHSSMSFEACMMEYGIQRRNPTGLRTGQPEDSQDNSNGAWSGWDRKFRMFGTRIL
ncbi:MAG: TRAPP subunit trs31 [Chaenotheca gracillima]|nr:MAG: TRAPP subunit trs31 [Chaenotheca gracillima]